MAQAQTEGGPIQSTFSSNHAASSSMTENKPSKLPVSKTRRSLCSRPHNGPESPDSLVQRKFAVIIVFALSIWSFYVIVGRVCTPMIRNRSASDLGRSVGAGTLVGFVILWLFFSWSYIKMIATSPGYARDRINKSLPPDPANYPQPYAFNPHTMQPNQEEGPDPSTWAPTMNLATQAIDDWQPDSSPEPFMSHAPRAGVKDKPKKGVKDWREIIAYGSGNAWDGQTIKSNSMDGQMIALIVVAAIFGLFAVTMLLTHVQLILSGRTTVESFAARDQREREDALLQTEYGYFWHNMEKRKVRKKWKEEWGGSPVDGRWRYGTRMDRWKEEMGISPLGWILPIGNPQGDGLYFKSNPKFGPHGEWLKKRDWPTELSSV
ncbi:hypothetical protein IAS59_005701 [Cryptococcus gattii]